MRRGTKPFNALCLVMVLVSLLTGTVQAENSGTGNRSGSLTASFFVENSPVNGTEFRIWRVGQPDRDRYLVWTQDVEKYGLRLDFEDVDGLGDLARTLLSCLTRDNAAPSARGVTDSRGSVSFTGLEHGLYLIAGDAYTRTDNSGNTWTYRPAPTLAIVWDEQDETIEIKHNDTCTPPAPERRTVTREVIKVWDDQEDAQGIRPDSVTVELLRDGTVYDTVELSEENSWHHKWTGLDASYEWDVVEANVPDGYTADVTLDEITYVVTNHAEQETTPENPPEENPPAENPPEENPPTENPPADNPPKLPQTGQDWRPVFALCGAGLVCLVVSRLIRGRETAQGRETN